MEKLEIQTGILTAKITDIELITEQCKTFIVNVPLNYYASFLLNSITHLVGKKCDPQSMSYVYLKGETLSIMVTNRPSFDVTQSHLQKNTFEALCQMDVYTSDKKLRALLADQPFVIEAPTQRLCSLIREHDSSDGELNNDMFGEFLKNVQVRVLATNHLFQHFTLTKTNAAVIVIEQATNICRQTEHMKAYEQHQQDLPGKPTLVSLSFIEALKKQLSKIPSIEQALLTVDGKLYIQNKIKTYEVLLEDVIDIDIKLPSPIEQPFPFSVPLLDALLLLKQAGHKHITYHYDIDTLQIKSSPVSYKIRVGLNTEEFESICKEDLSGYKCLHTGHLAKRTTCPKDAGKMIEIANTKNSTLFLMQAIKNEITFINSEEGSKREVYNTLNCTSGNIGMWRIALQNVKTLVNTITEADFEIFEQPFKGKTAYYLKTTCKYSNMVKIFKLQQAF